MRVAIDVGSLVGNLTGIGRLTEELIRALEQHPGIVVAPYLLSFRSQAPPNTTRLPFPAALAHRCWSHGRWPSAERWLGDADVVHGTNYVVPPPRRPTVVSVHDTTPFTMQSTVSSAARRFPAMIRRAVGQGAWVHTISDNAAGELRTLLNTDRVVTVYPGPVHGTVAATQLPALVRPPFLLAIGTIEPRKNHARLVAAFAVARREVPDLQLVLVGAAGAASPDVAETIARLGLRDNEVVVTGFVDDGTRAALLRDAVALAYPSLDEGFGFPLLEAMASNTPIVASHAGAIPEIAGDAALLVNATDVDAIAAALVSVCTDDDVRRNLVLAGQARLPRYSWREAATSMATLYDTTIRNW
jgi:glycosyltransferase involved in cell wall biosynthesis